jgi:hypothetical protein
MAALSSFSPQTKKKEKKKDAGKVMLSEVVE